MKQAIIIFGQPGAGKGTQAELLAQESGFYHFETSRILEQEFKKDSKESIEIEGEKYNTLEEKKTWEKGELCSPPFVLQLVKDKVKELFDSGESIVFSGSPRTLYESERLIPYLKELYGDENIKALFIKITAEETLFRNSNRRICELMRHPILFNDDTKDLKTCPLDGSKLIKRGSLDDPETIKVRLKEYAERTFPVIDDTKKQEIETKEINGSQSVVDVFKDILNALK